MTEKQQTIQFANELEALINRFRLEYDMSYASVIGLLHIKAYMMSKECQESEEEVE